MASLVHASRDGVEAMRSTILGVDPRIAEGIKWKAPSFRTTEYFATIHLREKFGFSAILHLGAKVRPLGPNGLAIDHPSQLLTWLGKDRARVHFTDLDTFSANREAFIAIIRAWITHV
jgi:hypothetical protein